MICGNIHNKSTMIHIWLTLINVIKKPGQTMPIVDISISLLTYTKYNIGCDPKCSSLMLYMLA